MIKKIFSIFEEKEIFGKKFHEKPKYRQKNINDPAIKKSPWHSMP